MSRLARIAVVLLLLGTMLHLYIHTQAGTAYAQEDSFDTQYNITVDTGGALKGFWGLITGKYSFKEALVQADITGSISATSNFDDNAAARAALEYHFSKTLEAEGSLLQSIGTGISFTAEYSYTWQTEYADITAIGSLDYSPSDKRFTVTGTAKVEGDLLNFEQQLISIDLNKMKVESEVSGESQKLLGEWGLITAGDTSNPDKPDTLNGRDTGSIESSESVGDERQHWTLDGLFEVDSADPTSMNVSAVQAALIYPVYPAGPVFPNWHTMVLAGFGLGVLGYSIRRRWVKSY